MYTNDVFISYKRDSINEQWLDEIFVPLFTNYLNEILPEEARIFVDREGIINGTNWKSSLSYELAHSKCMVAILSPSYFMKRSEWCVREFVSMKYREDRLGLRPNDQPPCLIWPVLVQSIEGNKIPPLIHEIQLKDYSPYKFVGEGFKTDRAYFNFQQTLRKDCRTISQIIEHAPAWRKEWESPPWMEKIEEKVAEHFNLYNPKQGL